MSSTKKNNRSRTQKTEVSRDTFRILAAGELMNNNTRLTGLNNNDLIIGPTGAGKTRGYVMPNIMQANESLVVADTKGNLKQKMEPLLKQSGYIVLQLDFKAMDSTCRWNPLDYISYDKERNCYSERDIAKVCCALAPIQSTREPFWDHAARQYLSLLVAYTMDFLPEREHTLESVLSLFEQMDTPEFDSLMNEACQNYPDSTAAKYYRQMRQNANVQTTHNCIKMILSEHLHGVSYAPVLAMFSNPYAFRFSDLGRTKIALFVNISDTDRSMDNLVGLFYEQAFQDLCNYADYECEDQKLPVPVRFILDDFATNITIPDFDKIISVIRSRDIYASVILQSITQLTGLYGEAKGYTIIDNCDNILYLGGQSLTTAEYISARVDLPENSVLEMPLDEAWLITRGRKPKKVGRYNITSHARYCELDEAKRRRNDVSPEIGYLSGDEPEQGA